MNAEKKEVMKRILKVQLKAKVRPHRSAAKVLNMAIAFAEERIEIESERQKDREWELEYLSGLDSTEIEEEIKKR
jgi:LPS O-antigen subunit length determinant protein (WzzB/FepE family)